MAHSSPGCLFTLRMVKATEDEIQKGLNAALKVNIFTQYNAKVFDVGGHTISEFYSSLVVSEEACPTSSYVSWNDLYSNNALNATFTGPEGKLYRLPTYGEQCLLLPQYKKGGDIYYVWWNDNPSTNTDSRVIAQEPFKETIYLKNKDDGSYTQDDSHLDDPEYTLSGISQLRRGTTKETDVNDPDLGYYNIAPVYGIRFKGTNQYAAYRWESCKISDNPLERYLSIKIKALKQNDQTTTIDDVAKESFWNDEYIEFQFPASGFVIDNEGLKRGIDGCYWSSSRYSEGEGLNMAFDLSTAVTSNGAPLTIGRSLRFVHAD